MGCVKSKHGKVCRNCQEPLPAMPQTYSMHVHHLPQREGDTYHVVALTSSTLGSLKLDPLHQKAPEDDNGKSDQSAPVNFKNDTDDFEEEKRNKDFSLEGKSWSKIIDEKIPKIAPIKTRIGTIAEEPETINEWELMEGLEDTSPVFRPNHFRSFSFNIGPNSQPKVQEYRKVYSLKPFWMDLAEHESNSQSISDESSIVPEFDRDVIAEFRKSLEDLPPANHFHLKPALAGINEALDSTEILNGNCYKHEAFVKDKVVLYFTSLRGVRKTCEDCCHVRVVLKGLKVKVDERDVSMHSGFKEELKELLGDGLIKGGLPRVFVGKKYIGGAEEIRRMNEEGQLEKVFQGCETVEDGGGGGGCGGRVCEGCGDVRFVPCETCSGSCKIYYEADCDEEEDGEEGECGFQRCPDCNENGLIRCPICCD